METLLWILGSTFIISLISFVGALTLFLKEKLLNKILLIFVAFSAGALIGSAFLHLIPEAVIEVGNNEASVFKIFLYLIAGFSTFLILEQYIYWHHHHTTKHKEKCEIKPFSYLILIGDGIHNFIDGVIIAASFVVNFPVGIATVIAVALHEIPQELGDFGVLVYGGFGKYKALFLNYISALVAILGGVVGYLLYSFIGNAIVFLLPFAAGSFIYIAAADLIPEIKQHVGLGKSLIHLSIFFIGIGIMLVFKLL